MSIQKYLFICICGLPCLTALSAGAQQRTTAKQDSTIKGQTIQITQIYQPEIEQPLKPELIPVLPPPDTSKPKLQYTVPQQTLSYTYHSVPIRPLALGKLKEVTPFENYLKAGIGNLSSIYLDAGLGSLSGEQYQTAFHLSHLNQSGKLNNQQSSYTIFNGSGNYYAADQIFEASLEVRNRRNRFYGYDNEKYNYGSSALQQSFTDGELTLGMKNAKENDFHINYHPSLTFGLFGDNFSAKEGRVSFNLPAEYELGNPTDSSKAVNAKIFLGVFGNFVHFQNSRTNSGNNLVKINPALDVQIKHTKIHIGVSPAFGNNTFYLLPDFSIQTGKLLDHFIFSGGWKADVAQNTYLDLSLTNPFIDNIFPIEQTKSDQIFVGVESSVGKFVTFGGTVSWRKWLNLPVFINDYSINPDGKMFQVMFSPKVQALNLEAYIRYQPSEIIGLSAHGSWYNFYKTTMDKAWGYPMLQLDGLISFHPVKNLFAHAGLTFMDGIYALSAMGTTEKMPAIFDINAAAEYNIIPRFSLFLQANNLLNKNYQRWNQYPVYGINIIGGFRFKF